MITNQACLFLIFIVNGLTIGLLFDLFRILRLSFKTRDFVTYLEDIAFWILTGFIVLYSVFVFNNGEIRFYIFLGIALGVLLYMTIFSSSIIKSSVYIIEVFKKIFGKIFSIFRIPVLFIFKFFKNIFDRIIKNYICFDIRHKNIKNLKNKKDF